MDLRPRALLERARTPEGRKMVRYSLVSVISVVISQTVLFVTFGILRLWSAVTCNFVACAVATGPSYYLNRNWAWGKSGRSHLLKEVVPFWALAFLGLVFSLWAVDFAEEHARSITDTHLGVAIIVNASALAAFGILWVGKFVILNKVLFAHRPHDEGPDDLEPALEGRSGPT